MCTGLVPPLSQADRQHLDSLLAVAGQIILDWSIWMPSVVGSYVVRVSSQCKTQCPSVYCADSVWLKIHMIWSWLGVLEDTQHCADIWIYVIQLFTPRVISVESKTSSFYKSTTSLQKGHFHLWLCPFKLSTGQGSGSNKPSSAPVIKTNKLSVYVISCLHFHLSWLFLCV